MSTFSFGFVISKLEQVAINSSLPLLKPTLRIWARPDFHDEVENLYDKVVATLNSLRNFWDVDYPLCKLDIVALPGFSSIKPVDNWGLIVFKFVILFFFEFLTLKVFFLYILIEKVI